MDYYDSNGNAPFDLVASLNGIAAPPNTVTAGSVGSTDSAGSRGGASSTAASAQTASVSVSKLSGARPAALAGPGVWVGLLGLVAGAMGGGFLYAI